MGVSATAPEGSPIAIVCGGGSLPFAVADAALRDGRQVFLLAIEGWAEPEAVAKYPHGWISLGRFGQFSRLARTHGCRDIVLIGTLLRPAFSALRLDWTTLRLLPRLYRLFRGGDDRLLSGIGRIMEENGFRMLGAHEIAPEILVPEGPMGCCSPSPRDLADAARGLAVIDAMGPFDVGQAVVVADSRVLAVEAAEGTDGMLARVAEMRRMGRLRVGAGVGVLVKAPKPSQDRRIDLPSIGPATVTGVKDAGLAGIVVRAGEVIAAEAATLTADADRVGIFVTGMTPEAGAA